MKKTNLLIGSLGLFILSTAFVIYHNKNAVQTQTPVTVNNITKRDKQSNLTSTEKNISSVKESKLTSSSDSPSKFSNLRLVSAAQIEKLIQEDEIGDLNSILDFVKTFKNSPVVLEFIKSAPNSKINNEILFHFSRYSDVQTNKLLYNWFKDKYGTSSDINTFSSKFEDQVKVFFDKLAPQNKAASNISELISLVDGVTNGNFLRGAASGINESLKFNSILSNTEKMEYVYSLTKSSNYFFENLLGEFSQTLCDPNVDEIYRSSFLEKSIPYLSNPNLVDTIGKNISGLPSKNANAVIDFSIENQRFDLLESFAKGWLVRDSIMASQWINSLPSSELKDHAIYAMVVHLMETNDKDSALKWREQISNTQIKDKLLIISK